MKRFLLAVVIMAGIASTVGALTLKEAIDISLDSNTDYKVEKYRQQIAFIQHNNGLLGMLPDVSLNYRYTEAPNLSGVMTESYSRSLTLSQPVFYNGREVFDYLSGYYSWRAARQKYNETEKKVIIDTISRYFAVLKRQEMINVWEYELQSAQKQWEKAQKLYELGRISREGLLENETYYKLAEYNTSKAKNDYEVEKLSFRNYLKQDFTVLEDFDFKETTPKPIDEYITYAKDNSYEYKNQVNTYRAAKYGYWADKMAKWPKLSVYVKYNYAGESFSDMNDDDFEYGFSLSLSGWLYSSASASYYGLQERPSDDNAGKGYTVTGSLLTGDATTPSVLSSKIAYLYEIDKTENKSLALERIVKDKYFAFVEAKDFYEYKATDMQLKESKRDRLLKQYDLGMSDDAASIEALREHAQARVDYLNAKYAYYLSWFNLLKTVGMDVSL